MIKWGPFQDKYLHPMQVTALLDNKNYRYMSPEIKTFSKDQAWSYDQPNVQA